MGAMKQRAMDIEEIGCVLRMVQGEDYRLRTLSGGDIADVYDALADLEPAEKVRKVVRGIDHQATRELMEKLLGL